MTSTASLLSAGEILKQDNLGRVLTPLAKRREILAAFDGSGMSAARFAAMVGINDSTFCSWVQERNKKQGKDSLLTEAATKPQIVSDHFKMHHLWSLQSAPPLTGVFLGFLGSFWQGVFLFR